MYFFFLLKPDLELHKYFRFTYSRITPELPTLVATVLLDWDYSPDLPKLVE